jgi:hypothetical protein
MCKAYPEGTVNLIEAAKTNYEHIKSLNIEDMANTIMCPAETGMADIDCDHSDQCDCYKCCLDWLQREYEPQEVWLCTDEGNETDPGCEVYGYVDKNGVIFVTRTELIKTEAL